jgi:FAD-dependent urate hydroxylase
MNNFVNPVASARCDVAVIGAGPYGLAAAACLRAADLHVRVFGEAMSFWRQNMPRGMKLRSPWIATHIPDPYRRYTLDTYFAELGGPPPALLPVENFINYGAWFQKRVAPDLDTRRVVEITAREGGFRVALHDGENVFARRVIMATGLLNHEYLPAEFDRLPENLVIHSSAHNDPERFRGRHVAVIGRGQSACESAALLHEAGADVEIICRGSVIWNGDPSTRSALRRMGRSLLGQALIPPSQVGPFPFNWLVEAPAAVRHLPERTRDWLNKHCLRATAILRLRSRLQDVPIQAGRQIIDARPDGERVVLTLDNGSRRFDHVLLATGYRFDVNKINILDAQLRSRIIRHDGYPVLSSGFESNVRGLHFVGSSAVASFGPLLRFIAGAGFAARQLTRAVIDHDRPSHALMPQEERGLISAELERS